MKPGQTAGLQWRGTESDLPSSSTPCWSRTLAVKFLLGDLIALGLISCPSFNSPKMPNVWTPSCTVRFYWKYRKNSLLEITRFVLTVAKKGLQHLVCPQSFFGGLKKLRRINSLLPSVPSLAPQFSVLCFLLCSLSVLTLTLLLTALSLPQTSCQGPAAFQESVEDEKSWNFSNTLLQIFNYILVYMEIYICIHFKFHVQNYWTLYDLWSGLILLWQDICYHKWIHNLLVVNSWLGIGLHSPSC